MRERLSPSTGSKKAENMLRMLVPLFCCVSFKLFKLQLGASHLYAVYP